MYIKTLNEIITVSESAMIPLFNELGDSTKKVEFYVFKSHEQYDGLIGNNILKPLQATIDYKDNQLKLNTNKITKLHFTIKETEYQYKIEKQGTIELEIPVQQRDGLAYLKEQKTSDGNIILKEGIYDVLDYKINNAKIKTNKNNKKLLNINPQLTTKITIDNFCVIEEKKINLY